MKKLFTALLLLIGLSAFSQSIGYFRYDSTRFEKVGGNNELILLNSTRDSIGVLYNMGNGRTRFRTISSLGISPNVANGIKKSVDTLLIGDSLDRATYLQVRSSWINNSTFNALTLGNRPEAQSLNGIGSLHPLMLTYNPPTFSVQRIYSTAFGDIDSVFYGGGMSVLTRVVRDSTDIYFKAGARSEILPGLGLEALGQYYPPRDSMVLKVGRDGQSGNVLFGQLDIGHYYGYNIFVKPPTSNPGLPISAARTSIDLARVIDNTRSKKMTGVGVSGFTSMYKTYQHSITSSSYPSGSYTDSVFGFKAYGDAYPFISGATKAQTLAVWTVKNSFGVYVDPQYRYTNTVDNGYSFYAAGDSDILVNRGFAYLGPSTSPVRSANTEGLRYRLHVTGKSKYTDSVNSDGIVKGYGLAAFVPGGATEATLSFGNVDSALSGAVSMVLPANRDGRHLAIRTEGFSSAVYPDNSPGMYIRFATGGNHANVSRISRNGNWTFGNTAAALAYRWWKKGTFSGSTAFLDTMTYVNTPIAPYDTTNYKPIWQNTANGDLYRGYHSGSGGGGGSGTVTNVATGYGLSGGPITTTGTLLFDSATVFTQLRGQFWNQGGNSATAGSQTGSFLGTTNSVALRFKTNNTQRAYIDSARNQLVLGAPTVDANTALIVNSLTNNNFEGLRIFYLNNTGFLAIGPGGMTRAGSINISTTSGQAGLNGTNGNLIGLDPHAVTATALLHVGASTTNKAGVRLASTGALPTGGNILAGNIDAIGDKIYYTVATGPAQKELSLNDGALTSGRFAFTTTNGRLTDASTLTTNGTAMALGGSLVTGIGFSVVPTVAPGSGTDGGIIATGGTITENGSGNHTTLAGVYLSAPTVTGGAATVTKATTLYIDAAPTATVSDRTYAMYVNNGEVRFNAAVSKAIAGLSTTTTLDNTWHTVLGDDTGGSFTVNLPAAASCAGRVYIIKKINSSANTITIDGNASETIDGATTVPLSAQWATAQIQSNGTNWFLLNP